LNKKADFAWENLAKIIIALVLLVIVIGLISIFRERIFELLGGIDYFP